MSYSNFKITHQIKDPKSVYTTLTVATFDYTYKKWYGKTVTNTVTVFKEFNLWKAQSTGMHVDRDTQRWLDAQETLGEINGNVQVST